MCNYAPPFELTIEISNLLAAISERIGQITVLSQGRLSQKLRRVNQIRSIHSSLAIENNTLSLEEMTAVIDGKRILGPPDEIKEVQNAYKTYRSLDLFDPGSVEDLLSAHRLMMDGLIPENGRFRSGAVGVFSEEVVIHMAPPAPLVQGQITDLFAWYKRSELHPLIKSAVFHYEFEFIHPFSDGNGRVGRSWHSLLLGAWNPIFYWIPVEEVIRERQEAYYDAFRRSNKEANGTAFVQFMLDTILDALMKIDVIGTREEHGETSTNEYIQRLVEVLGEDELSSSELMERCGLSHRASFRKNYLIPALEKGWIEMTIPDRPNSPHQRYRKR